MSNNTQTVTLAKAEGESIYRGGFQVEGAFSVHAELGKAAIVSVRVKTSGDNYSEVLSSYKSDMDEDFGFLVYPKDIEVCVQDAGFEEAPSVTVVSASTITPDNA